MTSKKIKKISLISVSVATLISIPVFITACSSATPSTTEINNTNNTSLLESDQAKEGVLGFWQNSIINTIFSKQNTNVSFEANSAFTYTSTITSSISLTKPKNRSYNNYRANIINAYNSYIAYNSQTTPVTWWNTQITTWLKNTNLANQINQQNNLINPTLLAQNYLINKTTIDQILQNPQSLNKNTLGAQQYNNLNLFLILFNNNSSQMQSLLNSFYLSYLYLTQQNMSNIEKGSNYSTNINNNSSSDFTTISNIDPNNPNFFLIKYLLSNTMVQKWQFTSSAQPSIYQNEQIGSLTNFNSLIQKTYDGTSKKESSQFNIPINDPNTDSSSIFGYDGVNVAKSTLTDGAFSSNIASLKTFTQTMSGVLDPSTNELIPFAALGSTGRNQIVNNGLTSLNTDNLTINSTNNNVSTVITNDLSIAPTTIDQLNKAHLSLSITNVSSSGTNLNISFNINGNSKTFDQIQPINFTMIGTFTSGTSDISIPFSSIFSNLQSQLITEIPLVNNKVIEATYYNRLLPIFNINAKPSPGVSANVSKAGLFSMVQTPWATTQVSQSDPGAFYGDVNPYFVYSIIFSTYTAPSSSATTIINKENLAYALFVTTKDFYIKLGYKIQVGNFAGNSGLITQAKTLGIGN